MNNLNLDKISDSSTTTSNSPSPDRESSPPPGISTNFTLPNKKFPNINSRTTPSKSCCPNEVAYEILKTEIKPHHYFLIFTYTFLAVYGFSVLSKKATHFLAELFTVTSEVISSVPSSPI